MQTRNTEHVPKFARKKNSFNHTFLSLHIFLSGEIAANNLTFVYLLIAKDLNHPHDTSKSNTKKLETLIFFSGVTKSGNRAIMLFTGMSEEPHIS
jgi:hypothetical protein